MNPKRKPLGIHFGPEGSAPEGTRLHIITAPASAGPEDEREEEEVAILRGQMELGGPQPMFTAWGLLDMSKAGIEARWRAAGRPLPDEPGYKPGKIEQWYDAKRSNRTAAQLLQEGGGN
jgi:hypothetical protein